jgi:hypothetical protein
MATNPPKCDGRRYGAVKDSNQVLNSKTDIWTKRDAQIGKFMDGKPFKGVRKEK